MKRTLNFKILLSMVLMLLCGQHLIAQCLGGAISTSNNQSMIYTCPGDGQSDLVVFQNTGSQDTEYTYLVTDQNDVILEIVDGDSFDFENAPIGECHVWGVGYTGNFLAQPGQSVFGNMFSDDCYNISYKCITVFRVEVDGGNVSLTHEGGDVANICLNDGGSDIVSFSTTSTSAQYTYVVTDENNNILAIPEFNYADFGSAPVGICRVWGLSYTGSLIAQAGQNAATVELADNCFDLSDNFITVYRNEADGGTVAMPDGQTYRELCTTGSQTIVGLSNTSTTSADYIYLITDAANNFLQAVDADTYDFAGVPDGTCRVWGLSHTGNLVLQQGSSVFSSPITDGCWEISSTAITVVRTSVVGGTLEGGPFEFFVDGTPDFVSGITLSGNAGTNQAWVITDEQGNILGLPLMPGVVDFDGAGAGVCLIWSLSFEDGLQGAEVGMNANDLVGCYSLSNPITVTRLPEGPSVGGIVINEINGNDRFEIKNTGNTTVDISNYWICDFPSYSVLSSLDIECDADLVLDPDEVITLVSNFDISGDDGEFGLYLNTSWSDPNSIIDYVEWGSSGHTRANVAIAAGIWSSADFVPAFPNPMSIHYDGTGNDASDWSVAMFSPCESLIENDDETELQRVAIQDMTAYPNPTKEVVMMTLDYMRDNEVEAQVSLLNSQGQVVQSKRMNLVPGNNQIEMSLSNYPGGIYLLDVRAENIHETIRIVKQQM